LTAGGSLEGVWALAAVPVTPQRGFWPCAEPGTTSFRSTLYGDLQPVHLHLSRLGMRDFVDPSDPEIPPGIQPTQNPLRRTLGNP